MKPLEDAVLALGGSGCPDRERIEALALICERLGASPLEADHIAQAGALRLDNVDLAARFDHGTGLLELRADCAPTAACPRRGTNRRCTGASLSSICCPGRRRWYSASTRTPGRWSPAPACTCPRFRRTGPWLPNSSARWWRRYDGCASQFQLRPLLQGFS